ncbi:TonB-dependent receptor [Pedobacter sp. PLR]|uniref:SusC/RagA family TonB-linked outer membrane protein n=1 Tax=Pedobacter sp. PLR TaxID=2994465 RepID=UPI0022469804|nr:TonB-dependent receptor [Pedobacter sp. PLR]MCX2453340.1 TonB-dependent receptor [Pedobacter sp. PLR]
MQLKFTRLLNCHCNKWLFLLLLISGLSGSALAQQKGMVTGSVNDDKGLPLVGVSVQALNAGTSFKKNTSSDSNGLFSFTDLPLGKGYSFLLTYIGFRTQHLKNYELKAGEKITLLVKMPEDLSDLNEVVVVGYGTQKKVNLTGAVASIDAKTLEDRPIANITQGLQGASPNLNISFGDGRPGAAGKINIRGFTSINSGKTGGEPLVLIDGVPGSINSINPRDVANISVLKDASSAAIYGARAAFGVILITTKNGKNGKTSISYSNNFGWSTPTSSTDFMTDGYDAAMMNDQAFLAAVGDTYTKYTDEDYAYLLRRKTDKSLPDYIIDNRKGKDQYVYYGNTDWWHTVFRDTQTSMNHSLSISGGGESSDFLISGRMFEQNGMMQLNQDKYSTYNLRAKINTKVNKWLTIGNNLQFNASNYDYPGWGVNSNFVSVSVHALPSYLPVNPDGTATYRTELNNYTIGDGIFADLLNGKSKGNEKKQEFSNLFNVAAQITKDLSIKGNYAYTYNPYSIWNRRTQAPWSIFPGVISQFGFDQLSETNYTKQAHVLNLYTDYNKTIGQHTFKGLLGYNQELNTYKRVFTQRKDLVSQDLNDLDLGSGDIAAGGGADEYALLGTFFRLNYDYAGKYLLEVNGRYDGSSKFPPGKRFGFFPSVSAGWRLSQEAFFEPLKSSINELKFRGSYGSLGNQTEAAKYGYIELLSRGTMDYIINGKKTEYLATPAPISNNLTWEKARSANFGVDAGFFDNRLTASFDYYVRNTIDMLTSGKTVSSVYGSSPPRENVADLQSRGWELAVNWTSNGNLAGKPFRWSAGLGLSDYNAEITRFDNTNNLLSNYYVGQKIGEIWGYRTDGIFQTDAEAKAYPINQDYVNQQRLRAPGDWSKLAAGDLKFKDLNGDGVVDNGQNTLADHGDLEIIGNSLPRYSFGINAGVTWGDFDLSAIFQGVGKQQWYPGNNADKFWGPYSRPYYSFVPKDFMVDVWTPENPDAYFPRLRGYEALNDRGSLNVKNDRYLQDLAYIRLKNLTIGYSLPENLVKKLKIGRARFYFSGENLFTFTKLRTDYIDPEQAAGDYNNAAEDPNARVYPFNKMYSFGLDVSF